MFEQHQWKRGFFSQPSTLSWSSEHNSLELSMSNCLLEHKKCTERPRIWHWKMWLALLQPLNSTLLSLRPSRARHWQSFHRLHPQKTSFLANWCHLVEQHSHQNDKTTATRLGHSVDKKKFLDKWDSWFAYSTGWSSRTSKTRPWYRKC